MRISCASMPGSAAYAGKVQGLWNAPADADRYDVALEAGQVLSLLVRAEALVEASLEVRDAAGALVASLVAPAGSPLALSGVRIEAAEPLPKMFDGDIHGLAPVEASVVPGELKVVVPADGG